MTVKRQRDQDQDVEAMAMANCLMLLSRLEKAAVASPDRVFKCKTCDRKFASFQALGGHRASHKKPRLTDGQSPPPLQAKPKPHECSICGLEFAIGQALGGHMRRHRNEGLLEANRSVALAVPILKKSSNSKRVWGLDLNLTPYENDLNLGVTSPTLDSFFRFA
ncbi:hypothetical protein RJ639_017990 [Escallonia herrerae]|uniref:C2H2-type domain-containing protein n=1 Tax=Escallonia herrerae TaxID=1293975 RepID=A0AA88V932_9ASTE|nr:hypothetical protein RJ639_017990 [Escallonia herrerae]